MSKAGWDKLSSKEQKIVTEETKKYIKILETQNRQSDKETVKLLKKSGYQINAFDGDRGEFDEIKNRIAQKMIDKKFFPETLYQKVDTVLKQYRE